MSQLSMNALIPEEEARQPWLDIVQRQSAPALLAGATTTMVDVVRCDWMQSSQARRLTESAHSCFNHSFITHFTAREGTLFERGVRAHNAALRSFSNHGSFVLMRTAALIYKPITEAMFVNHIVFRFPFFISMFNLQPAVLLHASALLCTTRQL